MLDFRQGKFIFMAHFNNTAISVLCMTKKQNAIKQETIYCNGGKIKESDNLKNRLQFVMSWKMEN